LLAWREDSPGSGAPSRCDSKIRDGFDPRTRREALDSPDKDTLVGLLPTQAEAIERSPRTRAG